MSYVTEKNYLHDSDVLMPAWAATSPGLDEFHPTLAIVDNQTKDDRIKELEEVVDGLKRLVSRSLFSRDL